MVEAPVGLVYDLARAPFVDDEELDGGLIKVLYNRTINRGGQAIGGALGSDRGLGAAAGALPAAVRRPVGDVYDTATGAMELAYREGLAEPLTALMTAASLADAGKGFDLRAGYKVAQNRSLGQSIALAFLTEDITDEAEVAKAAGTDAYEIMSGLTDAAMRITADPFAVAAKTAKVAQKARWTPTAKNLDRIMNSSRISDFRESVKGIAFEGGAEVPTFRDTPDLETPEAVLSMGRSQVAGKLVNKAGQELGDNDYVTLYHGTTSEVAAQVRSTGFIPGGKKQQAATTVDTEELAQALGKQVGDPLDYEPGRGQGAGVYLAATADEARTFGDEIIPVRVRVGDLKVPPERQRIAQRYGDRGAVQSLLVGDGYVEGPISVGAIGGGREAIGTTRTISEGAAARIRDRFFPDMPRGELASVVLAEAAALGDDALDDALRTLMGSQDHTARLAEQSRSLAEKIAVLKGKEDNLRQLGEYAFDVRNGQLDLFGDQRNALSEIGAQIDELVPEQQRVQRYLAAAASLREAPKAGVIGDLRTSITRSDTYQKDRWTKPVRSVFNMRPHQFVNVHDSASEIQVARTLRRSELDVAEQEVWRSEYMRAATPHERQAILGRIEDRTVGDMLEKAGVSKEQIATAMTEINQRRGRAAKVMKSRIYDGEGRSRLQFEDEGELVDMPLLISQQEDVIPLVDLDEVREAIDWIGSFRQRHGKVDAALEIPPQMMQRFYQVWRPAVLLRPAWPLRVQMDEQLRIIAKIGALATGKNIRTGIRNTVSDRINRVPKVDRIPGAGDFEYNGYKVQGAFDKEGIVKEMVSARSAFGTYFAKDEAYAYNRVLKGSGQFRSINFTEAGYGQAWERAVNRQIRNDPMARKFLAGETREDVTHWLRNTPEGQAHARKLPYRANKPHKWAADVEAQVHAYVPEDLRSVALQRSLKADDLVAALPDASLRPVVHGEILDQALGKSHIQHTLQNMVDRAFEELGGVTDVLARNPFFDTMYQAEVKRQIDLSPDITLGQDDLNRITDSARTYALGETKKLLYDLAEESDLAGILKNFIPFGGAWQEVITRWAGLSMENPAFVRRLQLVWQAPEKAGIITDENGAVVHGDGTATSVLGEKVEPGTGRYINMGLIADSNAVGEFFVKDLIGNIPGVRKLENARLNKDSVNTIIQGAPGFGPIVQIPVNAIVKAKPEMESSLRFILPFGASDDWKSMILPAAMQRLTTKAAGEDDRVYANQMMRIYFDKVTDYNLGKRDEPPTWSEAKAETDALHNLRFFTNFVSPASTTYQSPYQSHIDIYRAMKEQDQQVRDAGGVVEVGADERFYEQFGAEYFALTQSLSKSMDGIPPTVEGARMRKEHRELIEAHPELGSLIVGEEGAGEFSRAVYESQLNQATRPGSGIMQRQQYTPEEAARQPRIRLGWTEFSKSMDIIEAERIARGLPNLKVRAARDIADTKRRVIENLARQYPEWYEEFSDVDRTKWDKRITGFRAIVADEKMRGRREIEGLGDYLEARDTVRAELDRRKRAGGSGDITAASNMDVENTWELVKSRLIEENLQFESLFHRWLENDPITPPGPTAGITV